MSALRRNALAAAIVIGLIGFGHSPDAGATAGVAADATTISVTATGRPEQDQANLQKAIEKGQTQGRTVQLTGQFDLGLCVYCLRITAPVTIVGQADPTGPNPDPAALTVIRSVGLGPIAIARR